MTKQKKIALTAAIAVLAVAGGGSYWHTHRYLEETDNAYVQADISPVVSKSEGYVTAVRVADNQVVHAGDVLVELDDRDYANREAELVAQVDAKQAALDNLGSRISQQRAEVARAQGALRASQAEELRARDDASRFAELVKSQYATRQRAESAAADATKAAAQVQSDSASVSAQAAALTGYDSLTRQARADLAAAQAQLAQARIDRGNTKVRAAVDGVASKHSVQLGELVRTGTQLLNIVQTSSTYVEANFKETQLARMHSGQPVEFTVDAAPGVKFRGVVDSLSPASGTKFSLLPTDSATGNFTKIVQRVPVKVRVMAPLNWQALLRPGLSAVVSVDTEQS
jgi:membrane fusion protein (multidrug efflux system)